MGKIEDDSACFKANQIPMFFYPSNGHVDTDAENVILSFSNVGNMIKESKFVTCDLFETCPSGSCFNTEDMLRALIFSLGKRLMRKPKPLQISTSGSG